MTPKILRARWPNVRLTTFAKISMLDAFFALLVYNYLYKRLLSRREERWQTALIKLLTTVAYEISNRKPEWLHRPLCSPKHGLTVCV